MSDPAGPAFLAGASNNLRGILYMAFAAMTVSIMHVMVRWLSPEVHPLVIAFFRNLTALIVLGPMMLRQGRGAWKSGQPGLQAVRGVIGVAAMLTWFYGLYLLPVADATALSFTAVIFTAIGAILVLRERVGVRRWTAIAIGVVGTLIILRPGVQAVSAGALVVLLSSVLWAAALICVKVLTRTDSPVTIVFYSTVYFTPLSWVPALFVWQWPTWGQLGIMVAIGMLAALAHLGIAQAMREAETTVVMPIDFTRLIWAAAAGYLVFGEFPDLWTWIGAAIIFASTIYITYREGLTKRAVIAKGALSDRPRH